MMPGFDRTGPEGQGSRTGRQLGKCSKPEDQADGKESQTGQGLRRGMGRGAGRAAGRAARRGTGREPGRGPRNGSGRGPGRNAGHN